MESAARMMRQLAAFVAVAAGILLPTADGVVPVSLVVAVSASARHSTASCRRHPSPIRMRAGMPVLERLADC
jgi:hypothetical protein